MSDWQTTLKMVNIFNRYNKLYRTVKRQGFQTAEQRQLGQELTKVINLNWDKMVKWDSIKF